MGEVKWMLPVHQSSITDHDWVHPKAKYHAFRYNRSLCGSYNMDQKFFETDIDADSIDAQPQLACKRCYRLWEEMNGVRKKRLSDLSEHEILRMLEHAFRRGMNAGYGIDHENITDEENGAVKEFMNQLQRTYGKENL